MKFMTKIMNMQSFKMLAIIASLALGGIGSGLLTSCKEKIDESNLYTFTGETIEDYLNNRSDQYSSFNYILKRIGYDKILSAYGTYTCFAPNNDAVNHYIDSLYNDMSNKDLPRNGMTQPGLDGLTDSLCTDIALFHLLNTKVMGVYMGNGMTIKTILGRDINTETDTISGNVLISRSALITSMDNELVNGVLHEIDHVITRSNLLIAGELESHKDIYSLFSQALIRTGLADSLSAQQKTGLNAVGNETKYWVPEKCELGYTIFAETDEVFRAHGINSIDDMAAYANSVYAECATPGSGWYDYARRHNKTVSTGTDYENPWNALNMFIRYHIVAYKMPWDRLLYDYNQTAKVTLVEYYETMLPYTLMKMTRNSGKRMLNRWVENNSLTDRVAELGTAGIHQVRFEGVELSGQSQQIASVNGYIHPINDLLTYNENVPKGALNERMRFDDTALLGEMMSNSIRGMTNAEVKAHADAGDNYNRVRFPSNYFDNLVVYNGDDTQLRYLTKDEGNYSNYQGDEFLCIGNYDFALRLPPVPDGTYELRLGYTANSSRGMLQIYLGTSSELTDMQALDIPLDMRHVPSASSTEENPDPVTGWCPYAATDDQGIQSDANMHNLGYMRGPLYYTVGKGGATLARANREDLRRIIAKRHFEQGEYWLRFKTVIDKSDAQFHLDYIEFCPENVYNSISLVEDMY
ncbi:MAG: fasciclin domain-containing protein [Prevotella sp.]|nr:fasciclin domain-containing protein [Prevotella sp.]